MPSDARQSGCLLVLVGPSGVGKSTIARRLTQVLDIRYTVSATTRPKRPQDDAGKTYEHISREEFLRRLDADAFLEYAEVHGEYYGTPKHPTLDNITAGANVLLEIDVQGALQVKCQYPDAVLVFVLPPDEQTLLRRLKDRGRDSDEEIGRRFRAARREIQIARGSRAFDCMVTNDDLDRCVSEIVQIAKSRRCGGH